MKNVLIIGANSYIGRKLHEYVNNNKNLNIETFLVSASDGSWEKENFSKYDTVIHLAAIVHKKEKKKMKELYDKVNHRLAVEVALRAKDSGVKQFIFMSSASVYGKTLGCITKDTVPSPCSYYGESKLAAEKELLKLKSYDFSVAVLRPPMVYGEKCKGNYAKLTKLAKYLFVFPEVHNKRSVIEINELIRFIIDVINNECTKIYFPQDKEYLDISKLIVNMRNNLGRKTILVKISPFSFAIKKINLLNKIFGDFYYSPDLK